MPKLKSLTTPSADMYTAIDYGLLSRLSGRMPTLKEAEDYLIKEALRVSGGSQRSAAILLGITRQSLNKRHLRNPSVKSLDRNHK